MLSSVIVFFRHYFSRMHKGNSQKHVWFGDIYELPYQYVKWNFPWMAWRWFCYDFYFETGHLCNSSDWPGTHFIDRPGWAQSHRDPPACLPSPGIPKDVYHPPLRVLFMIPARAWMAEVERKVHCVLAHVISLFVFLETVSYYVIRLVSNSKFFL